MDGDDGTTNLMFVANWGYDARVTELLASGDGHLGCLQALLAANATIDHRGNGHVLEDTTVLCSRIWGGWLSEGAAGRWCKCKHS